MNTGNKIRIRPIYWLIIAEIIVLITGLLLGFKITYAPQLENDWNAISACASWVGVAASLGAILVAIRIPKVIAERQDKIALFEKRFAFYDTLNRCINFTRIIGNIQTHRELQVFFIASFGRERMEEYTQDSLDRDVLKLQNEATMILKQGVFLFDFDTADQVKPIISTLVSLLFIPEDHNRFWECYSEFLSAVSEAENILLPKVENAINIGR